MTGFRDSCIEFFKKEDIRKTMREMIQPIFGFVYNEIYIYIWIIAIYHVFFFSGFLILFWLMLKVLANQEKILSKAFI
jgi:hypothetical protein